MFLSVQISLHIATKKASAISFNNKGASTVQVTCEFCQETYQFEEDDVLAAV